jgi:hypothetical protein
MAATYSFAIDWNNDGGFSDTGEDVTARTLGRSPVTAGYGRDTAQAGSPVASGKASLELNNVSGVYSPENSSSPLVGNLLQARPVRLQSTLSAVTYTLFRGHTDDFQVQPSRTDRSVQITCLDAVAKLKGVTISTDLYDGITTGQAIGYVLDAAGWPAADRDIDTGATTIRWWWEERTDALDAVEKIVNSEGIPALVTVDENGKFVFRDRHHRLTRAASTTSQATFRDTGSEPLFSAPLEYDHGWRNVFNSVTFSVEERDPDPELSAVWSSTQSFSIDDGETLPVNAQTSDPFFGAVVPEAGTDYQLRSGTVTVTLSRSQGSSAAIFIKATGGPAVLDGLQLRAYAVSVQRTIQISADDSSSKSKYGTRSWPDTAPWAGVNDAAALANIILAHHAERLPIVSFRLFGNDTRLTQQLARDLSDRVTIVDAETGLNAAFYIERIDHTVSDAGLQHETVFTCEKVPSVPSTVFTFSVAGRGFDDGTFGLGGLSNSSTLFTFDVAGRGFDQGLLGY